MGKEDIGFIINAISIYKTIDSNYFVSPSNGYTLESLIALQDYTDNGIYTSGRQFFVDIFDNFICTANNLLDLDTIRRKLYFMENLSFSVKATFINNLRSDIFTTENIKNFYYYSYALITNLRYLINHIELKEESFDANEFAQMDIVQNNFRSYMLTTFWAKFFLCLSTNDLYEELHTIEQIHTLITPSVKTVTTTNKSQLERFMIQVFTTYDKKKTIYFDQVDYNSPFFKDLKTTMTPRKVFLYLYKDLDGLNEINSVNYTHNMLAYDATQNNNFYSNIQQKLYHVKYHNNGLKQANNIFIYGYYKNNQKNVLVGFAFSDQSHYQTSIKTFLYDSERNMIKLYGTFREGYSIGATISNSGIFSSITYQWEKTTDSNDIEQFEVLTTETNQSLEIPSNGLYVNHYVKCIASCNFSNGVITTISSKPYLINSMV